MVGVQPQDVEAFHQLRQTADELGIGPVPSVDGLVGVTHRTQIRTIADEGPDEPELSRVDVLELVDGQMAVPPPGPLGEGLVGLEEVAGPNEEVIEVHHAPALRPAS